MSKSPVFNVDHDRLPMDAASENARRTFRFFWRELSWESRRIVKGLTVASVKFAFPTDDGAPLSHEHMWLGDVMFDGETITGTLMNDPGHIRDLKAGDTVSRGFSDLQDWMYALADHVYGGFTVQVQRADMDARERRDYDAAWGLDFCDPSQVRIAPDFAAESAPPPKTGALSKLFGRKPAAADPQGSLIGTLDVADLSHLPEHAMSENAAPVMREQMQSDPDLAQYTDEDGWTLLHRDCLAGNLGPVRAMLDCGFDAAAKTPDGRTARDLAAAMGWTRIVDLLDENATRH